MLKRLISIFIFILLFSYTYAASLTSIRYDGAEHLYDVKEITLMLNDDKFEPSANQMPPIILENRTLVPVREVFEYLGGKVDWDGNDRRVDVSFDETKISLWIDKKTAKVNGDDIELDVPAKIVNDKTMVPARFISERAGLVVGWDGETYTVSIKFPKSGITNIGFANIEGTNCLVVSANSKISGYKYFSLPAEGENPFRLILDVENCDFKFDTSSAYFEEGMVSGIRFGNQGNNVNRIVLDLRNETDYVVTMSKDRTKLYYAMAEEFVIPGEQDDVPVKENDSGEKIQSVTKSGDNVASTIGSGDKVTINNGVSSSGEKEIQNSGERIVLNSGDSEIQVGKETEPLFSGDSKEIDNSGDDTNNSDVISEVEQGDNIIVDNNNPNSQDDITPIISTASDEETEEEEIDFDATISSIKYSTAAKRVKIKYSGTIVYSDSMLTNPNRLVIDIENAKLDTTGPTEINIKNTYITGVRFSQYTKSTVRVVLDLSTRCDYKIYKRSSEIQVDVTESTYKNIKYKKNTSNSQITLQNIKLDDIKYVQDGDKNKYVITYNEKNNDFGNGTLEPDDSFIQRIDVGDGKITIVDTGNMSYAIRESTFNVIITARKVKEVEKEEPEEVSKEEQPDVTITKVSNKKTILIDVGHGGTDPGACNGDAKEKVFNLNIALYLYDMLKSRSDIDVYIDRKDDDTYLNREDRVAYATKIDPDFIISVHNNSVENKSYSGTMVLYYNNDTESNYGDITSKECAEIVLSELIKNLNTINRGVVNRGDLHILSKTPCPSILCEVCFVSNDAELERLKTKEFQKDAAEAMYNGIEKILKIMN